MVNLSVLQGAATAADGVGYNVAVSESSGLRRSRWHGQRAEKAFTAQNADGVRIVAPILARRSAVVRLSTNFHQRRLSFLLFADLNNYPLFSD